jgi:hypothetical protein
MRILLAIACVLAAGAAGATSFQDAAPAALPPHPALYSFADIYRLTVGGALLSDTALAGAPLAESPVRLAAVQPAPSPELQFGVARMPEPRGWMLLLAGLALAGWVARRRLGYSF